jgi:hypothetical protein
LPLLRCSLLLLAIVISSIPQKTSHNLDSLLKNLFLISKALDKLLDLLILTVDALHDDVKALMSTVEVDLGVLELLSGLLKLPFGLGKATLEVGNGLDITTPLVGFDELLLLLLSGWLIDLVL